MSIEQAIALHRQGRLGEAEPIYRSVLSLNPDEFQPLYLIGMLKLQHGDPVEAVRLLKAAIERRPKAPEALTALAGALHMLGRHEKALAARESRAFDQSALFRAVCGASSHRKFESIFPARLGCFPQRKGGYLRADVERANRLRARLAPNGQTLVGLSWRSINPAAGRSKTASLKDFAALFSLPRCRFIDLQYGDTAEERKAIEDEFGVKIERLDDIDNMRDIDGLAALITACDLVASVSNTNAHLAGALGKPTWVFVPYGHARFWYWFKGKPDSPWYPRVRVKHQATDQSWSDAIAAAMPEISAFLASGDASAVHRREPG